MGAPMEDPPTTRVELVGSTALVTGGAVRLGRAISTALSRAGCRVVVHYGSSAAAARDLVADLQSERGHAVAIGADLGSPAACESLVQQARDLVGPIDLLINNAAIFPAGGVFDTTDEQWRQVFDLNLRAPFLLSRAYASARLPATTGSIVNILDARIFRPGSDHLAYRLAKQALGHLTEILALELAPQVRVNAVAPGSMLEATGDPAGRLAERVATQVPLGRAGGPQPVADAVLYLARSPFVTGEILRVDGGEYL